MLTLLLGTDWVANRNAVLKMISQDVRDEKPGRILIVPELISHDTERLLCESAGDTASRFAEVLTFTRLAKRVSDCVGTGAPECMDNGGRLVAMASATRQLNSKLKAYASVETRPEFLTGLVDAIDEFKRCCIRPEDLYAAAQKSEGSFAQKLEELSLIYEAYNSLCARGKKDPRDQMTWLLEQLEDSIFAAEHTFYVDGFPDFTRQHSAILQHLIAESENVIVSLTCNNIDSDEPAFDKAADTARELLRAAKDFGVETRIIKVEPATSDIKNILPVLFQGRIEEKITNLTVCRAETVHEECHFAAEKIQQFLYSGCRYRDISIVCADMEGYSKTLQMILSRYRIPVYLSGTEDILDKAVIATVLSAVDAVVGGFEQGDILRYLKSSLSPLSVQDCDKVENYAILWNITGNRWCADWVNHPRGLVEEWTSTDKAALLELNEIRRSALEPLQKLGQAMKNAVNLQQLTDALFAFLNEVSLDIHLQSLAGQMERDGDLRAAQVLGQLWEILLSAIDQLADTLGQTHWDAQTFTKLLKLLLSQYDVGTIPAVLDAVMVGPVSAMRCQTPKHLIVLGANEGNLPAYSGASGILTDQERTALRKLGVPLTGGALEGLQAEYAEIYGVFCGAGESVTVCSSGNQPSFLYRRLCEMSNAEVKASVLGVSCADAQEVAAFLLRNGALKSAEKLQLTEEYCRIKAQAEHSLGEVSADTVSQLYGNTIKLSASQVDKLADCRLSYFLKYGLRLQERKPAEIDAAEFGTYVHAVLEETGRKIMEMGGFRKVSLEETLKIANDYSKAYIDRHFSQIDSQRVSYLFARNAYELELVVTELWQELKDSAFEPADFELAFGVYGGLPPVCVSGQTMQAQLKGFVDRVDTWEQNGQTYYRVVDYKTGKKDFDYCDVFNGLGLQMLLYMFALEDNGAELLGEHPIPSGVQYFPARVPIVPTDGRPDDGEAIAAREKLWKRKGLVLLDETVLNAMEPSEQPKRMPYTRKKDGTISGDLADRRQMQLLKGYVFALLGKMVDDISSGCVEPNPYTRGGRHNACTFCPYGAVCHDATVVGRRNYAAMSPAKFWEDIEKEMSKRG